MSIKRTKQSTGSRRRESTPLFSGFGGSAQNAKPPSWPEDVAEQPDDAFVTYSMKEHFEKGALLVHPVFGKGIVISVEARKISVLFEKETKILAHSPG